MAARSSSTRWASFRSTSRSSSCAPSRRARSTRSAASARSRSTCASSRRPTATFPGREGRPLPRGPLLPELVFPIRPALRERKEDVPALVDCFVKRFNVEEGEAIGQPPEPWLFWPPSTGPGTSASLRTRSIAPSCSPTPYLQPHDFPAISGVAPPAQPAEAASTVAAVIPTAGQLMPDVPLAVPVRILDERGHLRTPGRDRARPHPARHRDLRRPHERSGEAPRHRPLDPLPRGPAYQGPGGRDQERGAMKPPKTPRTGPTKCPDAQQRSRP